MKNHDAKLLEIIPLPALLLDSDGRATACNTRFTRSSGISLEDIESHKLRVADWLDSQSTAGNPDSPESLNGNTGGSTRSVRLITETGNTLRVDARMAPIRDADGPPAYLMTFADLENCASEKSHSNEGDYFYWDDIWEWHIQEGTVAFSDTLRRKLGISSKDRFGDFEKWLTAIHPDDLERVDRIIKDHIAASDEMLQEEFRVREASGEYIWILARGRVVERDSDAQPRRMLGTIVDITSQRNEEDRLKLREAGLLSLVGSIPVMICAYDRSGNIIFWNKECERKTGYSSEEIVDNPDARKLLCRDAEKAGETIGSRPGTPEAIRTSWICEIICKDGSRRTLSWSSVHEEAPIPGWASWDIGVDITDKRIAESRLREEEHFVHSLLDTANSLIVCLDKNRRITVFNRELQKLTGYTEKEVIGKDWSEIFIPDKYGQAPAHEFKEWVKSHPRDTYEREIKTKNGDLRNILWSNSAILLPDSDDLVAIAVGIDVTDLKEAERKLRESEVRLRQMAEAIDEVFWILDVEKNKVIYINTATERILGLSVEQLYEDPAAYLQIVHPEDRHEVIDRYMDSNAETDTEYRIISPDGTIRWLHSKTFPILNEHGQVYRRAGIVQDITDQKMMERELKLSEEKHRTLVENVEAGIAIVRRDGSFLFINSKGAKAHGKSKDELTGRSMWELFPEDVASRQMKHVIEVIDTQREFREEARVYIDNEWRYYDTHVQPFHYAEIDEIVAMIIASDVTDRKRTEVKIKESEERFRSLAKATPIPVAVSDMETGKILYANNLLGPAFGYGEEEILGINVKDLYADPLDRDRVIQILKEHGAVRNHELTGRRKDGSTFWAVLTLDRMTFDGRPAVFGGFIDITDRKAALEEIREKERRFRELADLLPQTVFELDTEGNFMFVNKRGFESTGYGEAEVRRGLNAFDLFEGEDRERAVERFRLSMQGIDLGGAEYYLVRKDRTRFPVMIYSNPIVRDRKIVGMRGIAIDITDRKRAEDELRRTNDILVRERERLAKTNIALEEILDKTEKRTDKVKREITTNLERVLDPHLKRLKARLPNDLVRDFDLLVQEIKDVTDPWVPTLESAYDKLSHREIEVCNLIRKGMTSKEIGEQMSISAETVQKHRAKIRQKLGIRNKKVNLRSFLKLRFSSSD